MLEHPWLQDWKWPWPPRTLAAVEREFDDGSFWTTVDRDTGELIGSFGLPNKFTTRDAALEEAERFGSKWSWPTDRDYVEEE